MHPHWKPLHSLCSWPGYWPARRCSDWTVTTHNYCKSFLILNFLLGPIVWWWWMPIGSGRVGQCRTVSTSGECARCRNQPSEPFQHLQPFQHLPLPRPGTHTHIHTGTHVHSLTCTADAHCIGELKHRVCLSSRTVINGLPSDTLEWLGGRPSLLLPSPSYCLLLSIDNIILYITSPSMGWNTVRDSYRIRWPYACIGHTLTLHYLL
jgi:hypothetical protein